MHLARVVVAVAAVVLAGCGGDFVKDANSPCETVPKYRKLVLEALPADDGRPLAAGLRSAVAKLQALDAPDDATAAFVERMAEVGAALDAVDERTAEVQGADPADTLEATRRMSRLSGAQFELAEAYRDADDAARRAGVGDCGELASARDDFVPRGDGTGSPNEIELEVPPEAEAGRAVATQTGCLACHRIGIDGKALRQ